MNKYFCLSCGLIESDEFKLDHKTHKCFNCIVKGTEFAWAMVPTENAEFITKSRSGSNFCEICEINPVANPESDICLECAPNESMREGIN